MDLLVVRHAIAEDREEYAGTGLDDAARPTTAAGRKKFRRGARGLRRLVESIDLLATSPLVRAVETGAILQDVFALGGCERLAELAPGAAPGALDAWLQQHRGRAVVAVVGHEPHLSSLVEHLLVGTPKGFLELKKGGACLLSLGEGAVAGQARLRWLLTASQLRAIGER